MPTFDFSLALMTLGVLSAVYSIATVVSALFVVRRVPVLSEDNFPAPARWPRVSVIVPACNEAESIEAAVRSRLADDYPDWELVLVDDRSSDATGSIMEGLAREDPRVRVVRITELPVGWLGKLHALDRGVRAADGELLLFSDADVHAARGALRRAVARFEACRLDHLALLPGLWSSGPLLDMVYSVFFRTLCVGSRPWSVADPQSRVGFGVGAFNLVRRRALEQSPGFEHLRMEQVDDAALGQMLKRSGARCLFASARDELGLRWYSSITEMARATEKGGARWPFVTLAASMSVLLGLELAPWYVLVSGAGGPVARALAVLAIALLIGANMCIARWMRIRLLPAIFEPIGVVLLVAMGVRAAVLAMLRGGVFWRGTFYSTKALRAGIRYRLR